LKKATTPMKERKEKRTLPTDFMDPLSEMILSSAKISSQSPLGGGKIN